MMKAALVIATEYSVIFIDAIALVVILAGTVEAFVRSCAAMFGPIDGYHRRDIWLGYARWLVAGLTFQLAADTIETSITSGWDAVGRIAATAVIRTFLNFFLERDLTDIRHRQRATSEPSATP